MHLIRLVFGRSDQTLRSLPPFLWPSFPPSPHAPLLLSLSLPSPPPLPPPPPTRFETQRPAIIPRATSRPRRGRRRKPTVQTHEIMQMSAAARCLDNCTRCRLSYSPYLKSHQRDAPGRRFLRPRLLSSVSPPHNAHTSFPLFITLFAPCFPSLLPFFRSSFLFPLPPLSCNNPCNNCIYNIQC